MKALKKQAVSKQVEKTLVSELGGDIITIQASDIPQDISGMSVEYQYIESRVNLTQAYDILFTAIIDNNSKNDQPKANSHILSSFYRKAGR
jgi:hypothetical protein